MSLLINENIVGGIEHYKTYLWLTAIHLSLTFFGRFIVLNKAKNDLIKGKTVFNTIIVGNNFEAIKAFNELKKGNL